MRTQHTTSIPISIRLDEASQRHLRILESAGLSRSEAIREALRIGAQHLLRRDEIWREAEMVAADQVDRAEMLEVAAFMETLRAEG